MQRIYIAIEGTALDNGIAANIAIGPGIYISIKSTTVNSGGAPILNCLASNTLPLCCDSFRRNCAISYNHRAPLRIVIIVIIIFYNDAAFTSRCYTIKSKGASVTDSSTISRNITAAINNRAISQNQGSMIPKDIIGSKCRTIFDGFAIKINSQILSGSNFNCSGQFNITAKGNSCAISYSGNGIFQCLLGCNPLIRQSDDGQHDADHEQCQSNT